jgi:hypothetical protein
MAKNQKSAQQPETAGPVPEDLEIDLGAALPTQPAKPKRGRPRSATPKTPKDPNRKVRKDKGVKKGPLKSRTPYIDNNILVGDNINKGDIVDYSDNQEFKSASDYKEKLIEIEWKFLGFYLSGFKNMIDSMKSAGYKAANDSYLYLLAKKILIKYESQTEDHRIIFRAMGAGEVFVANGLIELAKSSKSDMVKLNAYAQIAKILGLTKEQLEGAGGITLIFEGQGAGQVQIVGPGAPPMPATPAALPAPASSKPMMITK